MKRTNIIKHLLTVLTGLSLLTACSKEELTPSGANDNPFAVPAGQNDATSQIRRNFYEKHGVHLLFTDTLRKEYVGKDAFNNDIWKVETLDLDYTITGDADKDIILSYLNGTEEQQKAVELVTKHIFPHLAKGGTLFPYSLLLVDKMEAENNRGKLVELPVYVNMRCLAISTGSWSNMEEEEELAGTVHATLVELVMSKFTYKSEAAEPFLAYCKNLYYEDIEDHIPNWDGSMEAIYKLGMLTYDDWYMSFDSPSNDFNAFFHLVMNGNEEEFMEEYGEYPVIVAKYNVMKETIINLGYNF